MPPSFLTLRDLLTDDWLQATAPERFYGRGYSYFLSELVYDTWSGDYELTGKVRGREIYSARITVRHGKLDCFCSCPVDDDALCKHLVALGLEWLDERRVAAGQPSVRRSFQDQMTLLTVLQRRSRLDLADMVMGFAREDKAFAAYVKQRLQQAGVWPPQPRDSGATDVT